MKKLVFAIAFYAICSIYSPINAQQNSDINLPTIGSQEKCLTDLLHNALLESDSSYRAKIIIENSKETTVPNQGPFSNYVAEEVYTIPIVVHIIHLGEPVGVGTNISQAQVESAINDMNDKFGSSNTGVNTNIQYCLAKRALNGDATNGINRINGSSVANYNNHGIINDPNFNPVNNLDVKALSLWPNSDYYNIWIVSEINGNNGGGGTQGYAYFPSAPPNLDGAVILYNAFGYDPNGTNGYNLKSYTNRNVTAIHELGHGLSLFHTFQGDNNGANCPTNLACGASSDCVSDTDPHIRNEGNCGSSGQTCFGAGTDLADIVTNIMSYSSDFCQTKFSAGQKNRMRSVLEAGGIRESLTQSNKCTPAAAPVSDFYATGTSGCENEDVSFFNASMNGSNAWNWTFENNGSSTLENPIVSWSSPGVYDVSLEATNNTGVGNLETKTDFIQVYPAINNYCTPTTTNFGNFQTGIDSVYLNTITNSHTANSNNGYQNFMCSQITEIEASTRYSFRIVLNGGNIEYCKIYIDYDGDGLHESSEEIYSGMQAGIHSGSFTTPANPMFEKVLNMRVISDFNFIGNNSCNDVSYGEVEDYGVYINRPPCTELVSNTNELACGSYTWNGTTYTNSGTYNYQTTNNNGCDSTATLNLTINNSNTGTDTQLACNSYMWIDGTTYTASNSTATHTLMNAAGCDSVVTLNLTINNSNTGTDTQLACDSYMWINGTTYTASNSTATHTLMNAAGCDSVVTLNLTINNSNTGTDTQLACNSYMWINGTTYTASNSTATHTLMNAAGCDSVVTLNLTINNSNTGTDTQLACNSYMWINGTTYTASNSTATHTLMNAAGCDSVVTLNLTINNSNTGTDTQLACNSYMWINGTTYTASNNTATHTLMNASGCDSVVTLNLTINNSNTGTDAQLACDSYMWIDGTTYTASNNTATHTLMNASGCDSVVTLNLTINNSNTGTDAQLACDSYMWIDGTTYTASNNTATHTLMNASGCDSVVTLNLTINNSNTGTDAQLACDSYMWIDGTTYTASNNTATHTLMNASGCDSVVTLNLTINNSNTGTDAQLVCDSYMWIDGTTYTASNNTATHTLMNASGCDSVVTLNLTINNSNTGTDTQLVCDSYMWIDGTTYTASNNTATHTLMNASGCDSVVTLNLTINNSNTGTDTQLACDSYMWINGTTYTTSNSTATHTLMNAADCDSVVTLNLTINNSNTGTDTQLACDSYMWIDGTTYTASNNTATHTLMNAAGCDSVVTLDLTINNSNTGTDTQLACDSYMWIDGTTYTASNNTATHTLMNASGCDSVVTLNLTINNSNTGTDAQLACDSYMWIDGTTYTASNNTATHTLMNASGCDSVVTLNLTINNSNTGTDAQLACDSYMWIDGTTYTASNNTATHTLMNASGCDSVVTLNLTINNSNTGTDTQVACDSYMWINGTTYTASNSTATHTLMNAAGCDSVVTLNLTINNSNTGTDTQLACNSYIWINGTTYTASNNTATHTLMNAAGCDSVVTLNLTINNPTNSNNIVGTCNDYTWNGTTYTSSGTYFFNTTNSKGCDSTATLVLTISDVAYSLTNIIACDSYTWNGTIYNSSGTYNYQTTGLSNCDSTATLNLTINNSNTGTDTQVACDSYMWIDGTTYTASNSTATHTLMNAAGCDSVVTLDLTINNSNTGTDTQVACDSYMWIDGTTYTTSNTTATHTLMNASGCDSVVTLNLTINSIVYVDTLQITTTCDFYKWNDNSYLISGIYNDTITSSLCDSIYVLNLTIEEVESSNIAGYTVVNQFNQTTYSVPFNANSQYQWILNEKGTILSGEYSTQLVIDWSELGETQLCLSEQTKDGCIKDTICIDIRIVNSTTNIMKDSVNVYVFPNPLNDYGKIYLSESQLFNSAIIYSIDGKIIEQIDIENNQTEIDLSRGILTSGVYLIRLTGIGRQKRLSLIVN